jgi:[pyruvate, water dikinase]-phosphate phosphotransferase / [pyruvate, water dikinase] kinase
MGTKVVLHLVSPASGEVVEAMARALVAQLADVTLVRHFWQMVRKRKDVAAVLAEVEEKGGLVLHSLIDAGHRSMLEDGCARLGIPCLFLYEPFLGAITGHFGVALRENASPRVVMDQAFRRRLEAMRFTLGHDDGIGQHDLEEADVVLLGASRVTKTPTCMFLAYRGIKAANVSLVAGMPLPAAVIDAQKPLKVGLTVAPELLAEVRRKRFDAPPGKVGTAYSDLEAVAEEVREIRRMIARRGWPVIDVTARSIDQAATMIMDLLERHREAAGQKE